MNRHKLKHSKLFAGRKSLLVCGLLAGLLSSGRTAIAEDGGPTPYRPTVSNPAELPTPGQFELEFGLQRIQGGDDARRDSAPYLVKYAFNPSWGLMLGGELFINQRPFSGDRVSGGGDTLMMAKYANKLDDNHGVGVEFGAKLATAHSGLGSGSTDWIVNGIYSLDIGETRLDTNLGVTSLGLHEDGLGSTQGAWAAALSRAFGAYTLAAEFSGSGRRGSTAASQFLVAVSRPLGRKLVLDAGVARPLQRGGPDWIAFAGFTYAFDRQGQ